MYDNPKYRENNSFPSTYDIPKLCLGAKKWKGTSVINTTRVTDTEVANRHSGRSSSGVSTLSSSIPSEDPYYVEYRWPRQQLDKDGPRHGETPPPPLPLKVSRRLPPIPAPAPKSLRATLKDVDSVLGDLCTELLDAIDQARDGGSGSYHEAFRTQLTLLQNQLTASDPDPTPYGPSIGYTARRYALKIGAILDILESGRVYADSALAHRRRSVANGRRYAVGRAVMEAARSVFKPSARAFASGAGDTPDQLATNASQLRNLLRAALLVKGMLAELTTFLENDPPPPIRSGVGKQLSSLATEPRSHIRYESRAKRAPEIELPTREIVYDSKNNSQNDTTLVGDLVEALRTSLSIGGRGEGGGILPPAQDRTADWWKAYETAKRRLHHTLGIVERAFDGLGEGNGGSSEDWNWCLPKISKIVQILARDALGSLRQSQNPTNSVAALPPHLGRVIDRFGLIVREVEGRLDEIVAAPCSTGQNVDFGALKSNVDQFSHVFGCLGQASALTFATFSHEFPQLP